MEVTPGFLVLAAWLNYMDRQGILPGALLSCVFHELGHVLILRLLDIDVKYIRITAIGAEIRTVEGITYLGELCAALAGPGVNLVLAAVLCRLPGGEMLAGLNLVLACFNLLPIGQLDGGRVAVCLLSLALGAERGARLASYGSWAAVCLVCLASLALARRGGNVTLSLTAAWILASMARERGKRAN